MEGRFKYMSERNYKGPKYPTKAHGSIPEFNSYEEEAEFWDTHDFTDFEAETKPAKAVASRGSSIMAVTAPVEARSPRPPQEVHWYRSRIPQHVATAARRFLSN